MNTNCQYLGSFITMNFQPNLLSFENFCFGKSCDKFESCCRHSGGHVKILCKVNCSENPKWTRKWSDLNGPLTKSLEAEMVFPDVLILKTSLDSVPVNSYHHSIPAFLCAFHLESTRMELPILACFWAKTDSHLILPDSSRNQWRTLDSKDLNFTDNTVKLGAVKLPWFHLMHSSFPKNNPEEKKSQTLIMPEFRNEWYSLCAINQVCSKGVHNKLLYFVVLWLLQIKLGTFQQHPVLL